MDKKIRLWHQTSAFPVTKCRFFGNCLALLSQCSSFRDRSWHLGHRGVGSVKCPACCLKWAPEHPVVRPEKNGPLPLLLHSFTISVVSCHNLLTYWTFEGLVWTQHWLETRGPQASEAAHGSEGELFRDFAADLLLSGRPLFPAPLSRMLACWYIMHFFF